MGKVENAFIHHTQRRRTIDTNQTPMLAPTGENSTNPPKLQLFLMVSAIHGKFDCLVKADKYMFLEMEKSREEL